jgi:hypothetical protein
MPALERRFANFLNGLSYARSIDSLHIDTPEEPKRADFTLCDDKTIVELKSLTANQIHKGEAVIDEYLKDTGIEVFGTLPLSAIARESDHLDALERAIYIRMTRAVEKICRSADAQIYSESSRIAKLTTGLLVILNESLTELDPFTVARRVWDYTHSKHTNIHYCLLIFESHKIVANGKNKPYPLLMDLTYSARQRRAKTTIQAVQQHWAKLNGYPHGLPDREPRGEDFLPNELTFGR